MTAPVIMSARGGWGDAPIFFCKYMDRSFYINLGVSIMGSRGLVPLRGRSEEGAEPPSFFLLSCIINYGQVLTNSGDYRRRFIYRTAYVKINLTKLINILRSGCNGNSNSI